MEENNELLKLLDLSTNSQVVIVEWLVSLFILILITYLIRWCYLKKSLTVSNKKLFANNFIPFALAIFLIVTSIKASLALSLGLVGALSIIRFRTAIKEPEQIVYLFIIIAASISLAAQQILPCIIITLIFLIWSFTSKSNNNYIHKDLMNVSFEHTQELDLESIFHSLKALESVSGFEKLKTTENAVDIVLSISAMSDTDFLNLKKQLESNNGILNLQISFISSLSF